MEDIIVILWKSHTYSFIPNDEQSTKFIIQRFDEIEDLFIAPLAVGIDLTHNKFYKKLQEEILFWKQENKKLKNDIEHWKKSVDNLINQSEQNA